MNKRAETGKMQFGNDWSGVFIRGDNALMRYLPILMRISDLQKAGKINIGAIEFAPINDFINLLRSADQLSGGEIQMLKEFDDCLATIVSVDR